MLWLVLHQIRQSALIIAKRALAKRSFHIHRFALPRLLLAAMWSTLSKHQNTRCKQRPRQRRVYLLQDQILNDLYLIYLDLKDMTNMAFIGSIKNSVNLVTGCAGGLGRAVLQRILKSGSGPTLGVDQRFGDDFLASLELEATEQKNLVLSKCDTFDERLEKDMAKFVKLFGPFDNVINLAGAAAAFPLYWTNTNQLYELRHIYNLLDFNTYGTFNVIRLASKYMVDDNVKLEPHKMKPKCIINTSCISTSHPSMGQSGYVASKSTLDSMTLCIARELSPFNIRCNTINVGYFETGLIRANDEIVKSILEDCALTPKRVGQPIEFAHLVNTIIENRMINGCCIKIDAGAREVCQ